MGDSRIPLNGNSLVDNEVNIPICDEVFPCKYGNLLKKQKSILAKEIAAIKNFEIFGVGSCDVSWDVIFAKSLIIEALECLPYGLYTQDEERCLIGQLIDNCNC